VNTKVTKLLRKHPAAFYPKLVHGENEKKRCGGKLVGELSCEWDNRVRDAQLIDRQTNKYTHTLN